MSFEDDIKAAMKKMLLLRKDDVVEVERWEERVHFGGYCETCYYEEIVVDIWYLTAKDGTQIYTYDGNFGALIRDLTDEE